MRAIRTVICAFFLAVTAATPAIAEMDLYVFAAGHNWREYGTGLHLDEYGPIFGLGISGAVVTPSPSLLALRGKLEGFGGGLDYDSVEIDPDDDTRYLTSDRSAVAGFTAEGTIGLHARLGGGLSIEPLAGFGYRYWMREFDFVDIEEERWQNVYGKAGLRIEQKLAGSPVRAFVEGGARVSIRTWTTYDLGIGDITVYPKNRTTPYIEGGFTLSRLRFTAFYEGLRFGASAPKAFIVDGEEYEARQPKTEADIFGLRIGAVF